MAKYYYKKRYYRKRKGIWSTRISNITGSQLIGSNSDAIIYYNLCQNPSQTDSTVSNKYTVKNVNLQLELSAESSASTSDLENFQAYIMYIPQGYVPTGVPSAYGTLPFDHPEWIMTHRFIGQAQGDNTNYFPPLKISSRLARKLDTGDRIVLIILGHNQNSSSNTIQYRGLVKYNTKAN